MKWFQNLSTMTKLMSAFAVVSVLLLAVGIVGVSSLGTMEAEINEIVDVHMKGVTSIMAAESDMLRVGKAIRQAVLLDDKEGRNKQAAIAEKAMANMAASLDAAEKTITGDEGKASMKIIRETFPSWADSHRKALELALDGRGGEAFSLMTIAGPEASKMSEAVTAIHEAKNKLADLATDEATARYKGARMLLLAMVVVGLIFAMGLGIFISRAIAGPLHQATDVLALVAAGDFTRHLEIDTRDELGQLATSLNAAVDAMRDALRSVSESASAVTIASSELSAASQSISSGAQEQASSLEETAASLEEMTSAVKQNADNAQQAAQLARGAREVAEKGGKVVGSAVDAMREINASSRKIADIITAIDEIAFQTNLLALNAAVEAARAGEQGRGFAVVAGEVRNLAQRSASAAKEIKGLINDSVERVESGSKLVDQSGATLEEIVTSVKRVTDIVAEIAASSREQSTGIEQVNTAVTQMDAVTQSNASQTEELAGTAEGLSGQAQGLMTLVQQFKLGDVGHTASYSPAQAAKPKSKLKVLPMRKASAPQARKAPPASAPAATGTDGFEEF